jgi:hypothetical protein
MGELDILDLGNGDDPSDLLGRDSTLSVRHWAYRSPSAKALGKWILLLGYEQESYAAMVQQDRLRKPN